MSVSRKTTICHLCMVCRLLSKNRSIWRGRPRPLACPRARLFWPHATTPMSRACEPRARSFWARPTSRNCCSLPRAITPSMGAPTTPGTSRVLLAAVAAARLRSSRQAAHLWVWARISAAACVIPRPSVGLPVSSQRWGAHPIRAVTLSPSASAQSSARWV